MAESPVPIGRIARMADVSDDTVRRDCHNGRIKGAVLVAGRWLVPPESADQYVRTRQPYDTLRKTPGGNPAAGRMVTDHHGGE
jgi:hypothetical protein